MLERELLQEYVELNFPECVYGKLSLETYLAIYDSLNYRGYVLRKALDNLINDIKDIFKRR
jgi:hypothetical protein